MVHDAVYHRGRHLVVAEDGTPPRELEVGGEDDGLALICLRDHLEQQPRPVGVERQEPQLVYDQELRLPDCIQSSPNRQNDLSKIDTPLTRIG